MVPSLPPELVATIVHHVGQSHKPEAALRETSLVARSWRVPSQKALFSTFNLCGRCYHALQIPNLVYLALQTRLGVYVLRISMNRVPSPREEVAIWLPEACPSVTYIGADFEDDDEIHFVESLGRFAHLKVVALATRNPALGRRAAEVLQRVHLSGFEIVSTASIITDVLRILSEGAIAQSLVAICTYPNEYMTFGQCFASFTNLRALSLRFLMSPDFSEENSGADSELSLGTLTSVRRVSLALPATSCGVSLVRSLFMNTQIPDLQSLSFEFMSNVGGVERSRSTPHAFAFKPIGTAGPQSPLIPEPIVQQLEAIQVIIGNSDEIASVESFAEFLELFGSAVQQSILKVSVGMQDDARQQLDSAVQACIVSFPPLGEDMFWV